MLKPLVKDNKLIDVLSMRENVEMFKYRIESRIHITDGSEEIIIKAIGKSLDDIRSDLGGITQRRRITWDDWEYLKNKGYTTPSEIGNASKAYRS